MASGLLLKRCSWPPSDCVVIWKLRSKVVEKCFATSFHSLVARGNHTLYLAIPHLEWADFQGALQGNYNVYILPVWENESVSCECEVAGCTDPTLAKGSLSLATSEMAGWRKRAGLKEQFGQVCQLPKPSCVAES